MNIQSVALVVLSLVALTASVQAQQPYPTKPVRMVVSVPPGGGMDGIARVVAKNMAASLGQAVIVENRPGGGENIGINSVAKAAPDGYTGCRMAPQGPARRTIWQWSFSRALPA